jgi:hypothetical protein
VLSEIISYCAYQSMKEQLVDAALEGIRQLYATKQALPTDENPVGATVLTSFCNMVFWLTDTSLRHGVPTYTQSKMLRAKRLQGAGVSVEWNIFPQFWRVIDGMVPLGIPTQCVGSELYAM